MFHVTGVLSGTLFRTEHDSHAQTISVELDTLFTSVTLLEGGNKLFSRTILKKNGF